MNVFKKMLGATALMLAAAMPNAEAFVLSFSNAGAFSGTGPNVAGTYATATFTASANNTVTLRMDVLSNMTAGAFIDEWYFNYSGNPLQLTFTNNGGELLAPQTQNPNTSGIEAGTDCCKADGTGGLFDFVLRFPNGGGHELDAGSFSEYILSAPGGLTLAMFENMFSAPDQGGGGGFLAAVHIQGFNYNGSSSVWVGGGGGCQPGDTSCTPVCPPPLVGTYPDCRQPRNETPEPGILVLIGTGLIGLAYTRRRRVR